MVLSDLYSKIYELRDLIQSSEEYVLAKDKENEMMNDSEFIKLSNAYMNKESEYNDLIKLGIDDSNKKKELQEAKEALYSYCKVKEYLEKYHELNEMLKDISNILEEVLKCEL